MSMPMIMGAFLLLGAITTGSQANPASQRTLLPTKASPSTGFSLEEKGKIDFSDDIKLPSYSYVKAMTFSPDSRYLNTGIRFSTKESDKVAKGGEKPYHFEYGGRYITYDIGQINHPVEVEKTAIRHSFNYDNSFTPDGRHLVRIDEVGQIVIHNVEDIKHPAHVMTLPWQNSIDDNKTTQASCVKVSSSGTFMVAGGRDGLIQIYNISDPKKPIKQSVIETDYTLTDVAISPDEKWMAFTGNGFRLMVYDLADLSNPKLLATEKMPGDKPGHWSISVAIAPDSKWLAVAGYTFRHSLLLYDMQHPQKPVLTTVPEEITRPVSFVDISRDGKLMALGTLGKDSGVTIYNVADPKEVKKADFIAANTGSCSGAFNPGKNELALDLGDKEIGLFTYRYDLSSLGAEKPVEPDNPHLSKSYAIFQESVIVIMSVAAAVLLTVTGIAIHHFATRNKLKKLPL
ncbi:WD40 repeat domain-containing protein [Endozoicomonas euniceicola]|uniref:WD40 repeat domain-containing protein n=1 Tax=Endozoicomonas euniceicola TaxID=1234143 RepID=A0ABY6GRQ4_9GAMM|nr:WD40 repeat domain-containing protein [Endozoicomonas euniceicola]UYM15430.1 WD40 repeat domain-containing protein [Endozoicomonas euniceicola]